MTPTSEKRITLSSTQLNPVFGKVSYQPMGDQLEVMFTILMAAVGEGWQTGVALDASLSMRSAYGKTLTGKPPADLLQWYQQQGWVNRLKDDGIARIVLTPEAIKDAIRKGHLLPGKNIIEPEARKFVQYLAEHLDADGGTTVIYWACGSGNQIEVLGDVRAEQCPTLAIKGPKQVAFGQGTCLLPALQYFDQRFADAPNGLYIFITDGRIDDLSAVESYSIDLAQRIANGSRHPLKAVLIGLGADIDEAQMIALDDLDTGTEVDIWDHKIAADMREITEIFAELVTDTMMVAPQGVIYAENDQAVARFTDGLPARVTFRMPATSHYFELEVAGQNRIRQTLY